MKKLYLLLITLLMTTVSFAQVFITELADPNDNADARYIELYNAGPSVVDLSTWRIDKYTNASATVSQTLALTGTIPSGGFYIIATGPSDSVIFDTWGVTPNQWDPVANDVAGSNGDDNLELYSGTTLIDQFGVPGVDGTATNHEFEDGRAERRASVTTGNATWDVAEWDIDSDAGTGAGPQNVADSFDPGAWVGTSTTPTIVVSGPLTGFDYFVGAGPSVEKTFTVEGNNLTVDISVNAPTNFEISTTSGSGFAASLNLRMTTGTVTATTVYARLVAGLGANSYNGDVTASSTGATSKTVALSGTVTATDPLITITGTAITGLDYVEGAGPSAEATFDVEALFLTGDLTVTPPTGFEVSITTGAGFASSVALTNTGGTVATTTIYIRSVAGQTGNAILSGNITASAAGATDKTLAVSGKVFSTTLTNALVVTGVFDALDGSSPKGVELLVIKNIADLSYFGLGSANNGGGTDGQEFTFPAVSVTQGQYIYAIGSGQTAKFTTFFGFAPDYESGALFINGDDAIELFENSVVIDLFGDINVDGNGTAWEYLDSWAYRNANTGPSGTFTVGNWTFGGVGNLEATTNAASTAPYPAKTYTNTLAISQQQLLDGFSLYPNPVRGGLLNVQSPSNTVKNISIFDVIGQQVYQRNTTKTEINISNLKAGLYFVKVQQDGKIATRKLVVE